MGSQQSTARTPVSPTAPSMRRLSRMLRRRAHDDHGAAQEELETPPSVSDACVSPSNNHMDNHPPLDEVHGLVNSLDSSHEQAPPAAQAGKAPASTRPAASDRVGSSTMEKSSAPTSDPAAAAAASSDSQRTALALDQVQAPSTSTSSASAPTDQWVESGQRFSHDAPAATAATSTSTSPVPPLAPSVEQVQSALAPSNSAPSSNSTPAVPVAALAPQSLLDSEPPRAQSEPPEPTQPVASSQSEPPVNPSPQSAFAPPDPARIPRTLPLGTTMIVQGLVQTIEVNRPPPPTPLTNTPPNNEPDQPEERRPLLSGDKPENDDERDARGEGSGQHSHPTNSDTYDPTDIPPPAPPPVPPVPPTISSIPPRPGVPPPSSTDVLGLLLSIAAQATAEALVPWSVPPRSRTLARSSPSSGPPWTSTSTSTPNGTPGPNSTWGREGIASGLAAAFSALAAAGGGLNPTVREPDTTNNTDTPTMTTDSAPLPETTTVTTLPTPAPTPAPPPPPVPVSVPAPQRRNTSLPSRRFPSSLSSRRLSSLIQRGSSSRRSSTTGTNEEGANADVNEVGERRTEPKPERRRSRVLGSIRRLVPWRSRRASEANEGSDAPRIASEVVASSSALPTPVDVEEADFGRAPPTPVEPAVLPESSVSPSPAPRTRASSTTSTVIITPPTLSETTPQSQPPISSAPSTLTPPSTTAFTPPSSNAFTPPVPPTPPTTDAEDLIRFSHMLGFTPGIVHPSGTFERFLADMQDELRSALGEYQERIRGRPSSRPRREREDGPESSTSGTGTDAPATNTDAPAITTDAPATNIDTSAPTDPTRLLDHTRPHIPSTDPLPLNWWRMYRFPALPDVEVAANSTAGTIVTGAGLGGRSTGSAPTSEFAPEVMPESAAPESATQTTSESSSGSTTPASGAATPDTSPPTTPDENAPQPVHPAIIIGLRSVSRDPLEDPGAHNLPTPGGTEPRDESAPRRVRSFDNARGRARDPWARRFGLRRESERREGTGTGTENENDVEESEAERRAREGTRNYIIWIIGGYYPSNHPLLAHPNLFLGQVHPDELWMLNEFLGQVKPPTASREDIAKAGLRVVKGSDVQELTKSGSVTENCTERCLICLDDYAEEEDLRIMNCKHMFHKDCVDRWMETGRNNCPACRTKGVDTTTSTATSS